ncbi:MAG: hypothetical protein OYM47_08905 [Gemmatimonadota bacterium]|nr:hypothetical protein [Gemmatimonadota bacterium]
MTKKEKKRLVNRAVAAESKRARELSRKVHGWAERPFREVKSSRAIGEYLASRGFEVEFPFKKIPTAFRATRGTGEPAVGLLGEYDALPNCGPEEGQWGHG